MTASPGDGEHAAREGYYPDPSIPGYVRYWNGASWVPGTSRPAASAPARVEETGPVFLDETSMTEALPDPAAPAWRAAEEPDRAAGGGGGDDPARGHDRGAGPGGGWAAERGDVREAGPVRGRERAAEPGSGGAGRPGGEGAGAGAGPAQGGWQVDPVHQAGFGGPRDVRVSWGDPVESEPARPAGISLARPAAAATAQRLPAQAAAESVGILSARAPAWPDAPGAGSSGLTSSWPEAAPHRQAPAPAAEPSPPYEAPAPAPRAPAAPAPEAARAYEVPAPEAPRAYEAEAPAARSYEAPAPERRAAAAAPVPPE
ncbi:DUF2510 domain-containing protein, partial [Streptomyces sp. NPDC048352]|uniref:DUF2510 domain-containing protein n=1 Tax=Streptomyces sp. NPDC048352 TaxID=3154718 RepID=UPI00342D0904